MYFCANSSGVMSCALIRSISPLLSAPVCTGNGSAVSPAMGIWRQFVEVSSLSDLSVDYRGDQSGADATRLTSAQGGGRLHCRLRS